MYMQAMGALIALGLMGGCATDKLRALEQLPNCMKQLETDEDVDRANALLPAKQGDTLVNVHCARETVREAIK